MGDEKEHFEKGRRNFKGYRRQQNTGDMEAEGGDWEEGGQQEDGDRGGGIGTEVIVPLKMP